MSTLFFPFTFRMYEAKLKELETDIAKKTQSLTDLKQLVRQATEREQKAKKYTEDLEQQASNFSFHEKIMHYMSSRSLALSYIDENEHLIIPPLEGPSK